MKNSPVASALDDLVEALRCLPGVGPRSAQRMAFHLLQRNPRGAKQLAEALSHALQTLKHCRRCNNFSASEICERCASSRRDATQLCIVETPADLIGIEQTHSYGGLYYVLMGRLSPLDGVGPHDLGFERLLARVCDGVVNEVILATNQTQEGEATAFFLAESLQSQGIKISRLARGLPVGGEIEYADAVTVAQALIERRTYPDV